MDFDLATGPSPKKVTPRRPARPAGFWLRAIAYSIDSSIVSLLTYFISTFIFQGSVSLASYINSFLNQNLQPLAPSAGTSIMAVAFGLFIALAAFIVIAFCGGLIYSTLFEGSPLQATPGKLILGIKVSDALGQPIGVFRAFLRNFAKILSYLTLFFGFFVAGLTPRKQALHDYAASTLVVRSTKISWMRIILAIIIAIVLSRVQNHFMPQDEDSSLHAQEFISSPSQSALNAWHSLIDGPKSDSGPTSGVIKYKDEQGKTYYVTQMESVPEKYRDKVIENPDLPPIQRFSNWGPKKKDSD